MRLINEKSQKIVDVLFELADGDINLVRNYFKNNSTIRRHDVNQAMVDIWIQGIQKDS